MNPEKNSNTLSASIPPIIWVDNSSDFSDLCKQWLDCSILYIDTEFERRTTYYPILALLQIYDGENIYLIDPLKVKVNSDFQLICNSLQIVKVMHACKEDLEVLYHAWDCQFQTLFDTQVAHAFLTGDISKGYASLVESLCQEKLDKQETQSNWLKRPLSHTQLDYAAKDVVYLPVIYQHLKDLMEHKSCKNIFIAECSELCRQVNNASRENEYRHLRDAWQLNIKELALLKALFAWRQKVAETENKTLNHIFKGEQLLEITRRQPKNQKDFYSLNNIHPRSIRLYSKAIIELIEQFNHSYKDELYENLSEVINPTHLKNLKPLIQALNSAIKQEADKLAIVDTILLSKRVAKRIAYCILTNESLPRLYSGWRGDILKPVFEPIFSEFKT